MHSRSLGKGRQGWSGRECTKLAANIPPYGQQLQRKRFLSDTAPLTAILPPIRTWELSAAMLSRSAIGRQAQQAARRSWQQQQRRGLAAPASGSFQYETGDAQGIKYASRDIPGPVASLAIVAQAGTRYQFVPGLAEGLNRYAFKVGCHTHGRRWAIGTLG